MQIVESFQNRLQKAMNIRNIKQVELVEKSKLDKSLLNKYLSGVSNAGQKKLTALANALNVNEVWLMGYDVPMERELKIDKNIAGIEPHSTEAATVFVYGTIPAGTPIECIENILDTEEIPLDMLKGGKQFFGLKIKGNSMFPEYIENDVLILEKVEDCENGDDCVVMVNGNDGTFKRVFKNENGVILQPLNPEYQPMIYTNKQIEELPVKVIGKVVELRRKK
jgi:repressor LexA